MKAYERLLRYVQIDTTSQETSDLCPSTPNQKIFGERLVQELHGLGLKDANMDENGYVLGRLPATAEGYEPLGLLAHMDTSNAASGADIRARIVKQYDGGDILLNPEKGVVLSPKEYPALLDYIGQDLVVTDGTTLLGGDDKAGIAEIVTALEELEKPGIPHGEICVAFTPDEEIGRGADCFPMDRFGARYAYTVDGGKLGELEYENFNGADAFITIQGTSIHPGDAKGKMKNALLLGIELNSLLPAFEIPAHTEGYEGFTHLTSFQGSEDQAQMHYLIRDHSKEKYQEKKERLRKATVYLNDKYGAGTFQLTIADCYFNMKEKIEPHFFLIENAKKAMLSCGVTPLIVPIRGGTDGAKLSYAGLPCPNLSTGGHNFHGRFEFIPVQSMDKMVEVLLSLATLQKRDLLQK